MLSVCETVASCGGRCVYDGAVMCILARPVNLAAVGHGCRQVPVLPVTRSPVCTAFSSYYSHHIAPCVSYGGPGMLKKSLQEPKVKKTFIIYIYKLQEECSHKRTPGNCSVGFTGWSETCLIYY